MLEEVFGSDVSLFSNGVTTLSAAAGSVCLGVSTTGGAAGSGAAGSGAVDGCSLIVSVFSWDVCSSFALLAWTSSNHFSNIGTASSKLGVPDEEIFCFPSI